ncbi:MAG: hypothetical protein GY928_03955 [Colwellia sp.]|nr:hypothetical protein [Colwellia sp.]
MPEVFVQVPHLETKEKSSFNATAYFRVGSTATAPTTAKYRVDNLTTRTELKDWTSLTVATSNTIAMTSTFNAIQNEANRTEKVQLTVASDPDGDTENRDTATWTIINLRGFDE